MKRISTPLALIAAILVGGAAVAQDEAPADTTKVWNLGAKGTVTVNQQTFSNWAAGGINSISLAGFVGFSADYSKDRVKWENDLEMAYGFIDQKNRSFQKTDDKLRYSGNLAFKISPNTDKLYWSSRLEFLTQFADGFDSNNDTVLISTFMAPGYIVVGTGLEYNLASYFSLNYSPVAFKFTIVSNQDLANQGRYGVEPAVLDTAGNIFVRPAGTASP